MADTVATMTTSGRSNKEIPKLTIELCSQSLVRRQHNCRALMARDHIGDSEGLARARHTEQGLRGEPVGDAFGQGLDRFRLMPGRGIVGHKIERLCHQLSRCR